MVRERTIQVSALSIDANPHPENVYVNCLSRASKHFVKSRANDSAKITKLVQERSDLNFFSGRILVWTDIDMDGSWLDLNREDALADELKADINIPDQAKPNYRTFNYLFNNKKHIIYFETLNELGESLGPKTARAVFSRLLSKEVLGESIPDISVSIVPDENALEKVLGLPGLRSLTIRVNSPNADTSSSKARKRVLAKLEKANARQLEEKWIKASNSNALIPTEEMQELASVAAETGYVRSEGRAHDGKKLMAATDDFPKKYFVNQNLGDSFFTRLKAAVGSRL